MSEFILYAQVCTRFRKAPDGTCHVFYSILGLKPIWHLELTHSASHLVFVGGSPGGRLHLGGDSPRWRVAVAVLQYLDMDQVEHNVAVEAHLQESSDDE